jgi:hypothetical protein
MDGRCREVLEGLSIAGERCLASATYYGIMYHKIIEPQRASTSVIQIARQCVRAIEAKLEA